MHQTNKKQFTVTNLTISVCYMRWVLMLAISKHYHGHIGVEDVITKKNDVLRGRQEWYAMVSGAVQLPHATRAKMVTHTLTKTESRVPAEMAEVFVRLGLQEFSMGYSRPTCHLHPAHVQSVDCLYSKPLQQNGPFVHAPAFLHSRPVYLHESPMGLS